MQDSPSEQTEQQRQAAAADRVEISELSGLYMRGLDRLDPKVMAGVFWPNAFLDYGIYEGGPEGFIEFCQQALTSHVANHHMLGQINIDLAGDEAFGEVYYQAFHRVANDAASTNAAMASGGWPTELS